MSSYCHLEVGGYPLIEETGDVHPWVMTVFQDSEKRSRARLLSERNPLVWGDLEDVEEDEEETVFEYSTIVKVAIQRLEIMGFTLERARAEFEARLFSSRGLDQEEPDWYRVRLDGEHTELWKSFRQRQLELYRNFTFDTWLRSMKEVISRQARYIVGHLLEQALVTVASLTANAVYQSPHPSSTKYW